ncbi:MAG TPA: hypothetical protein VFM18_08790, partial [Methanosarcina sp.]|nr:hypothetical protein [Methanosarcina sp.]
ESILLNLLARIHRDGGHYVAQHGIVKAAQDADLLIANIYADPATLLQGLAISGESIEGQEIVYDGGPVSCKNTRFTDCHFKMVGAADYTFNFISHLEAMQPGLISKPLLEAAQKIRQPQEETTFQENPDNPQTGDASFGTGEGPAGESDEDTEDWTGYPD